MPHKFNAARRHKFPKKRYRVTNWAEYTEILRRRGDLTIWVTDDTLKQWRAPRRTTPGGQPKYSNIAIETCLTLRTIYKLPLRQTQGLMRSIARLMGVELVEGPGRNMVRRRGESAEQIARLPRAEIVKRPGAAQCSAAWVPADGRFASKVPIWRWPRPWTTIQSPMLSGPTCCRSDGAWPGCRCLPCQRAA